ncbi:MAG: ureidoglycolate dehydrogenase [[Eubacterium] sulci]|uniref:ureidoglycolate dehydrogenase n=1 Tax=Mogibacterium TaxID=86331 RepID=UPI00180A6EBE|nr:MULTISPECIES: ureidoglycolate dehydrogenase [Mogibacterium]MBF1189824.1 ureidoglycolate dehydrogenase [[Eubacterium] sulci]MBB1533715.1 ureidoglycolate dehydrogenase [Mogibacterium sp.]MBF1319686.1 ureidoglycolate dehydrogenase [Mogibacterium diversum]MBF1323193.1 ureidoglycolate dehydrogenase [Mogibacterium diversum]MBF1328533.1 ureidoglycolate dehydrogenase [Mogibacterium diversum]
MKLSREELKGLMKDKLMQAGLHADDAETTAEILTWAHERGYYSHGAVRVEYYSERIAKGGITVEPNMTWKETGPCSGILDGDNGIGFTVAKVGMEKAIEMAKKNGIAVVGMANLSHSGSIGYYTEMAADEGLLAISFCQSDPMAVPYGGAEPYYGTNPMSFAAPTADDRKVVFDMATTVQAWGKILDKRSKHEEIPADWAVDENGAPVTDPHKVNALNPIAGAKGYGLMMLVDVFSGILLGVPFGGHVSSMYHDLSEGRRLGQMHIVIDPERFVGAEAFKKAMSQCLDELDAMKPAPGFDKVNFPGERAKNRMEKAYATGGLDVADELVEYLKGEPVHFNRYDHKNRFAD